MESARLEKELIADPSLWVLLLRLSPAALHVAAFSLVEDNSLIYRRLPLDRAAVSVLKATEDAVYDNPLLLSDFKKVYCVVESPWVMPVPAPVAADNRDAATLFNACFDSGGKTLIIDRLPEPNAAIITGVDSGVDRFIHRTFSNLTVTGHLASLSRYFHLARSNSPKMYVNFRDSAIDIVIIDGNRLLHANTYNYTDVADAVYYILACRNRLGLNSETDELLLCGDAGPREAVTPLLRRYISLVMPVIFPPRMFKAGREAMKAPFDLIVTPLCE